MRRFIFFIPFITAVCCLWCACTTGNSETEKRLFAGMDSLLEANPDSAYKKLQKIRLEVDSLEFEELSQQYIIYLAEACNKLDKRLPSDTVLKSAIDYYKKSGTPNQQMKSHYLLGCCYRDRGESPLAIEMYEQAVDCADTASSDCDNLTLMRIYGQMAEVYHREFLPSKEIEANREYSKYAKKIGNQYEYIRGVELQMNAYNQMGDTSQVLLLTDSVCKLYMEADMNKAAASAYGSAILIKINNKDLATAKRMMDIYENESGLFDEKGEIVKDRWQYYFAKGKYYMEIGDKDSSEYMFHKLGRKGLFINEYYGLIQLYKKYENSDSIYKYSMLYDKELVKYRENLYTQSTANISSLYNFKRLENLAISKTDENQRIKKVLWFSIPLLIIIATVILYIHFRVRNRLQKDVWKKENQILDSQKQLEEKQSELLQAKSATTKYMMDKEEEIEELKKLAAGNKSDNYAIKEQELMESEIVAIFRDKSELKLGISSSVPTEGEWKELERTFKNFLPGFYKQVLTKNKFTSSEKKVCLLCRIGIKTHEIQILLEKNHSQSISNIKSRIISKMFPDENNRQLEDILKDLK